MLFFIVRMKVKVLQRSRILRYDGSFSGLSAFLLCPSPVLADSETADIRGDGEMTQAGADITLTYREEESGASVTVEKKGDTLTVMRGGARLVFRLGEKTAFTYRTAYGELPTEAYTDALTLQKKGSAMLICLSYVAVFGGMAQRNEMRFKIT